MRLRGRASLRWSGEERRFWQNGSKTCCHYKKTGYPAGADIQSCPELLKRVPDIAYAVLDRSGTQACYRAFQDI
ncbi:hypothetical protein K190097F3_16220 [Enterocloster clostridioformis]